MCNSTVQKYGANPISIKWNVVRGDTAELYVDFFELDETTGFDCSDWTYKATAYDVNGDVLDELTTTASGSSVTITAPSSITSNWGTAYKTIVSELIFDLQVLIDGGSGDANDVTWTPIIGTISVIGDVTPGSCL